MGNEYLNGKRHIIVSDDGRVYVPKKDQYLEKFKAVCNRLQKKPSETIAYLIDVEEIMRNEDLEDNAGRFAEAVVECAEQLRDINPKAHEIFVKTLRRKGVAKSWDL